MAVKPQYRHSKLTSASESILNAIRNSGSTLMKEKTPELTRDNVDTLRQFGQAIMDYPTLKNEMLDALVNRIARTTVTSRLFYNPWSRFKKGIVEMGEIIEEIFVELIDPEQYDLEKGEKELFKNKFPDVKTAFHIQNYEVFYKVSILDAKLRKAFVSFEAMNEMIAYIIERVYTSAEVDEFNVMKYLLAVALYNGIIKVKGTTVVTDRETAEDTVIEYREDSNNFEFMSTEYNFAGVPTSTPKDSQVLIVNTKYEAVTGVKVLANAFNIAEADYPVRRVLVDGFNKIDWDRLRKCYSSTPDAIIDIPDSVLEELAQVQCILLDEQFFQIYDNLAEFTDQYNAQNLGRIYFYHVWKTISTSPFSNAVAYIPTTPSVTTVSITPDKSTASVGMVVNLKVTVEATGFAPKTVKWQSSDTEIATVNASGNVELLAPGTVTITAMSTYDNNQTATATIEVVE